ncbi:RNA polymerase sigma factor [Singulisphaera sp. PoT]|uniref:RNA polymerase sigma factor n=1 Tax=Singulisphaera sp. PoT TaxID=3411797 RepID=UPI003BF61B6E
MKQALTSDLQNLLVVGSAAGLTDGQLLERSRPGGRPHDPAAVEAAFSALVDRHAAMVWGVCRRTLRERADAEDAFQATFLVLMHKGASVRLDDRGSVGRWLYGVSRKVAARQRRDATRRPSPPSFDPASGEDPSIAAERRDACEAVTSELGRLPERYRRAIEACDFDGLTYEAAARSLGWPTATVKSRLARGRARLRDGLARRGLAPALALATGAFAAECRAGVPRYLIQSTARAGLIATGTIPAAVARLVQGVAWTMLMEKLRPIGFALLVSVGVGVAATASARSGNEGAAKSQQPPARERVDVTPARERVDLAPNPKFTRKMKNGTVVEVLAVSSIPSGPKTWWRPDGTPLAEPAADPKFDDKPGSPLGKRKYQIIYEVNYKVDADAIPDDVSTKSTDSSVAYSREVNRNGKELSNLRTVMAVQPESLKTTALDFEAAYGPWETVSSWDSLDGIAGTTTERGPIAFTQIVNDRGQMVVTVAHVIPVRENQIRVVAVDKEGKEHSSVSQFGEAGALNLWMRVATFDLPKDQIESFRFQRRPIETITIPDIALEPTKVAGSR